ncbi:MAG TPA: hypothetical protein VN455_10685 [Methanotrichaceae archaeon]|nr:hypothetical protein [Methanotrichaceae archaeon]
MSLKRCDQAAINTANFEVVCTHPEVAIDGELYRCELARWAGACPMKEALK